jgi:hypothetical protein
VGGWFILGIVLVYGLLFLGDVRRSLEGDYNALTGRAQRLESLLQEDEWSARARAVQALRLQLEGRFWHADSRGMAQAQMQTWIDNFKKLGFTNYQTLVEDAVEVEGRSDLWQVAVRVEADFDASRFLNFLRILETRPQLVVVQQLDIRQRGRKPHFILVFKTYFRAREA